MATRHNKRHLSSGKLPTHARPSRPAALTKRSSYNHATPQYSSNLKSSTWTKTANSEVFKSDELDEDGMASFPQFCTTCDKQIITPNFTLLYCSEACRRKDAQLSTQAPLSPPLSPLMPPTYHDHRSRDILPQRSPTILRPLSNIFSDLSLSSRSSSPSTHSDDDDSPGIQDLPGFPCCGLTMAPSTYKRTSLGSATDAPPSLVHSPSSSYGTVASFTGTSSRPLPLRQHSIVGLKSVDLVAPPPVNASLKTHASTLTILRVAEAEHEREREDPLDISRRRKSSQAAGSLKQLFNYEGMRAKPR